MRSDRKDYIPLSDEALERLKGDALPILGSEHGCMTVPAKTIYWLVKEIIDAREEIFRLQLCETVDEIINEELEDDEEDLLAISWPDDFSFHDEDDMISGVYRVALPRDLTGRLPGKQEQPVDPDPTFDGRRLPRLDE
jgi:hypothetical protein